MPVWSVTGSVVRVGTRDAPTDPLTQPWQPDGAATAHRAEIGPRSARAPPDALAGGSRIDQLIRPSLIDRVERDHRQPDHAFRRRRIVSLITLVIGTTLLGLGLAVTPGDAMFYVLTFALAATWVIGSFVSGPLHLGRIAVGSRLRRPVIAPILIGLAVAGVFVVGALIAREIPILRDYAENVLAFARYGSLPLVTVVTLVNGIAEEIFFRGALFAAIGLHHPVVISTVIYTIVTLATGNPMLVFAACTLGFVLGLQRRASGRHPRPDPDPRHLVDGRCCSRCRRSSPADDVSAGTGGRRARRRLVLTASPSSKGSPYLPTSVTSVALHSDRDMLQP